MGITATEDQMSNVTDTWERVTVSGTPTRTGLAKLTIMTYLTNVGASAWMDFDATGVTQPVLNTLTGDFWADGHFSTILFDTGTITPAEFWKTLTASIDETGSFGNLFKDYIDAKISDVPSDVWDEILTGATHNIPTSAGRRVREIGAYAIHSGTAQAGNSHTITLAASASPADAAYDGIFNRNLIVLTDNTGVGQTRTVVDYDAVTKIVVVDRDWRISPDATTEYQITPDDTPLTVDHGVARGGTNRTITIRDYAASDDNAYLCNIVAILAGKGRGQARLVESYNGTTNVVTICGDDWVIIPDATSVYAMMPYGVACAACMGPEAVGAITTDIDANSTQLTAIKAKTDHISEGIAKGVALNAFTFTMFDLNGNPATGLTVALYISQDGGSFTLATNSVSEISMGAYKIDLIDAEMNANVIALGATATSAAQTSITIVTV